MGNLLSERHGTQKVDAAVDALRVRSRQLQHAGTLGAHRDDDGLEIAAKILEIDIPADLYAASELHAQAPDQFDLGIDEIARQAVCGDAGVQHTRWPRLGFKDGWGHAHEGEVVSCRQSSGSGTDDRHAEPVRPVILARGQEPGQVGHLLQSVAGPFGEFARSAKVAGALVGHEPFEGADGDWLVYRSPAAGSFARGTADPSTDRGERIRPPGD